MRSLHRRGKIVPRMPRTGVLLFFCTRFDSLVSCVEPFRLAFLPPDVAGWCFSSLSFRVPETERIDDSDTRIMIDTIRCIVS